MKKENIYEKIARYLLDQAIRTSSTTGEYINFLEKHFIESNMRIWGENEVLGNAPMKTDENSPILLTNTVAVDKLGDSYYMTHTPEDLSSENMVRIEIDHEKYLELATYMNILGRNNATMLVVHCLNQWRSNNQEEPEAYNSLIHEILRGNLTETNPKNMPL